MNRNVRIVLITLFTMYKYFTTSEYPVSLGSHVCWSLVLCRKRRQMTFNIHCIRGNQQCLQINWRFDLVYKLNKSDSYVHDLSCIQ